jgi:hypothetical protein
MAAAHLRTGRVAVDYAASVSPLRPPLAGAVTVRVYKADLALGLTLLGRNRIVVRGYSGEPFLRFGPDGAYAERSSLTAAGLGLVTRGTGWRLLSREPRLIWHDARVRGLPPGARRGRWAVPVVVDGTRAELVGVLRRPSRPPDWPWATLGAVLAAAGGVLVYLRRPSFLRTGATAFGWIAAVATLLVTCGFAAASTASEGVWVEAGNEILFVLIGVGFLIAGGRDAKALVGGALGLLAMAVGLKSLPVFLHGVVLSALPANLMRTAVVLAISAGAAAAAVALVVFFDVLEHYEEPASMERYL